MSGRDDGGPAYPVNERQADGAHWHSHLGVTLRDYFAARAMQAILATDKAEQCLAGTGGATDDFGLSEVVAALAYDVADAMLRERAE